MENLLGIAGAGVGLAIMFSVYFTGAVAVLKAFDSSRPRKNSDI